MQRRRYQLPPRRLDASKQVIQLAPGTPLPLQAKRELDISKITLPQLLDANIYLGTIADVARHIEIHHPHKNVTIINLYACGDENPLLAEPPFIKINQVYSFKPAPSAKGTKHRIDIIDQSISKNDVIYNVVNVYVHDAEGIPIHLIFDHLADKAKASLDSDLPVYFSCQRGISRSSTALLAMMGKYIDFANFDEAVNLVKSQRTKVEPKFTFMLNLEKYFMYHATLRAVAVSSAPASVITHAYIPAGVAALVSEAPVTEIADRTTPTR